MESKLDPVLMGAVEQKIVEGMLRLQEAYNILNCLKEKYGYEITPLEQLSPTVETHSGNECLE